MTEIIKIGQMDNTVDGTYESANRVYDRGGAARQSLHGAMTKCRRYWR